MSAVALNCPNCGAGVSSDSSICQFCRCRLKTMACAKCFGLMFIGSQFCDHCGAIAAPLDVKLADDTGACPRCQSRLERFEISETTLRGCSKCDGLWLDASTFQAICIDRERQAAVLGFATKRTHSAEPLTKINYVPCPDCGELMNRNNFAKASGVIVDICRDHGVWFDTDELPAIVDFIHKGGMEMARRREMDEIKAERDRFRSERFTLGGTLDEIPHSSNEDNLNIRTFIQSLFG